MMGGGTFTDLSSARNNGLEPEATNIVDSSSLGGGSGGGNALLLRFIDSQHFSMFMCVSYLERYASNPGIHWYLCSKLRSYPSEEIEFFLPQLVQLQVTVETESMALEDLLVDLCNVSTHCTLLVFWQLQAHLTLLSDDPHSYGFQACKRIYNKLQYLLFNVGEAPSEKMRENIPPSTVLASMVSASIACPSLLPFIKPLVVSQGRKQRSHIFHVASKLLRTNSTPNLRSAASKNRADAALSVSKLGQSNKSAHELRSFSNESLESDTESDYQDAKTRLASSSSTSAYRPAANSFSSTNVTTNRPTSTNSKTSSLTSSLPSSSLSKEEKVRALKTNYFRCETQFMYALQSISTRLMTVPKQARLSALRAELVLLNRELPAEVDIPLLLPSNRIGLDAHQHKIVRISPAEATVLNSAEKVPFLLLIEYLKDEVDFSAENPDNEHLINADRRYIFDMTHLHDMALKHGGTTAYSVNEIDNDEVGESDIGDISALNTYDDELSSSTSSKVSTSLKALVNDDLHHISPMGSPFMGSYNGTPKLPAITASAVSLGVPATTNSPRPSDLSFSSSYFTVGPDDDVNEIASHMRTAAVMLTQLDTAASGLNHKDEVNEIKSKIIASMQSMEDHTLFHINKINQDNRLSETEPAGDRRTENDLKIASTKSDDPSAANLGEDWNTRKERIRRTSPYGHLPNWDLFSIIAKTGNDLRQEAFACQLIQAMTKIWAESGVDVWVKKMSILITSESYGLVETITNGLSIHSIKKALTNQTVRNGTNPKGTIACLKDYFKAKFPTEESYNAALECFVKSLAPYSLICYLLQIKDRHNGNILLDSYGHIIHIDFGFLLTNTPGSFGFETAPFKLTHEYLDLMGGSTDSEAFLHFRDLLKQSFRSIRKHADDIIILVEMMSKDSDLPCFESDNASLLLRQRFQLHLSDAEADQYVDNVLIQKSVGSMYTRLYDQYQLLTQGIYS